jgi:hypothetical protein
VESTPGTKLCEAENISHGKSSSTSDPKLCIEKAQEDDRRHKAYFLTIPIAKRRKEFDAAVELCEKDSALNLMEGIRKNNEGLVIPKSMLLGVHEIYHDQLAPSSSPQRQNTEV